MKRFNKFIQLLILFSVFFCSCLDDGDCPGGDPAKEISVHVHVRVSGLDRSFTKAVNENLLQDISLLVFDESDNGDFIYSYLVPGFSLSGAGSSYLFRARLIPHENPIKVYIVANAGALVNAAIVGSTEEEVKQAITGTFNAAGFMDTLPMFGEVTLSELNDGDEIDAILVRSVARVDIINNADNFILTSVQVYRASDQYQIIPDLLNNDVVTTPSIPEGTTQSVNTDSIVIEGINSVMDIYVPESPLPDVDNRRLATVIVIGGLYGSNTDTTYYRLDFVPDDTPDDFGQILRNHRYQFNINEVLAPGWEGPDEASEYESTQVEVEIKIWNESTTNMVFDNVNYFGVTSRIIEVKSSEGAAESIGVDTNLDSYELYWLNGDGTINGDINPITIGGSFTDPDSLFTVSIADNGGTITVVANSRNESGERIIRNLRVYANRLRLDLTVVQNSYTFIDRTLNFYGSTTEIGSLGDRLFGNTDPNSRMQAYYNFLTNTDNFGPGGTVPFQGISIAGQSSYQISANMVQLFDVIYMTYAATPNATTISNVLSWLAAVPERVLIVQYDSGITNRDLMNALGFTFNTNYSLVTNVSAFVPYENAPSNIMNGPFGQIPDSFRYRCYDTTHGEINLQYALSQGISPILIGGGGGVVLGIDFNRRIVYSGDIDLGTSRTDSSSQGIFLPANGVVGDNQAAMFLGNLWAWIIETVLYEEQ